MKYSKRVLLAIEVPEGNLCFGNGRCCQYFNNEGDHPDCKLNLDSKESLSINEAGEVNKPEVCRKLYEYIV